MYWHTIVCCGILTIYWNFICKMAQTPVKQQLSVGTLSPNLSSQLKTAEEVSLTLDSSNKFLRQMYSAKADSYVEYLNKNLKHIQLNRTDRLENHLGNVGSRVTNEYKKLKGGSNKQKFDNKVRKIALFENEMQPRNGSNSDASPGLDHASENKISHTNDINQGLRNDFSSKANTSNHESDKVNFPSNFLNKELRVDKYSKANKSKVVRSLEGKAGKALEFIETFGLIPKKLACETFDGEKCNVSLDVRRKSKIFENMLGSDKRDLRKLLHVCDSNMISDSAYHELSMHCEELPRKHLLFSCRNEINTQ